MDFNKIICVRIILESWKLLLDLVSNLGVLRHYLLGCAHHSNVVEHLWYFCYIRSTVLTQAVKLMRVFVVFQARLFFSFNNVSIFKKFAY